MVCTTQTTDVQRGSFHLHLVRTSIARRRCDARGWRWPGGSVFDRGQHHTSPVCFRVTRGRLLLGECYLRSHFPAFIQDSFRKDRSRIFYTAATDVCRVVRAGQRSCSIDAPADSAWVLAAVAEGSEVINGLFLKKCRRPTPLAVWSCSVE